ncbi:MAG: hypothetical protein KatS3mg083_025 [Candidatus Dojkabacteria bacterium]|nr:MAG: hypothetical protein KatS3mg083_025 [Candidatus Dojkabacteria bacterium]
MVLVYLYSSAAEQITQELVRIADMVFSDPPWYADHHDFFLRRSMWWAYGRYATVAFVLLPLLTRPASFQERRRVLRTAMSYRLSIVPIETYGAHCHTPRFGRGTLAGRRIEAKNRRRDDLAVFILDGTRQPKNVVLRGEVKQWRGLSVGRVKMKAQVKDENPDAYIVPELLDFAGGDVVLPTVSRRDLIRKEIDLWTSTQRGSKIKGGDLESRRRYSRWPPICGNLRKRVAGISGSRDPRIRRVGGREGLVRASISLRKLNTWKNDGNNTWPSSALPSSISSWKGGKLSRGVSVKCVAPPSG